MKYLAVSILVILLGSCARKSAPALYEEAQSFYVQKEFQKAADDYEEIVARFPNQSLAESALSHLASLYSGELKDSRKAVNAYRRSYLMFPSGKQAPTMLFLTGFIYNNELHEVDSARQAYESFLRQYPGHELAASAKFELETLGKDPGQALSGKIPIAEDTAVQRPKGRTR